MLDIDAMGNGDATRTSCRIALEGTMAWARPVVRNSKSGSEVMHLSLAR